MDCNKAIEVHVHWKARLSRYVAKPDRSIDAAKLGMDNQCELGKWLSGDGRKHSAWAGFSKLVTEHAQFHRSAADLVKRADAGERVDQEVVLGARSEYAAASNAVVSSLMRMRKELDL